MSEFRLVLLSLCCFIFCSPLCANDFVFSDTAESGLIIVDSDSQLINWAAGDVAADISTRTGIPFSVTTSSAANKPQLNTPEVLRINLSIDAENSLLSKRRSEHGVWESFAIYTTDNALQITGADERGAVYGLFTLAEKLGISPWQWWADVPLTRSGSALRLSELPLIDGPAVKYRGVFLNDEDWGLLPWAANTFEPEEANLGPATYEKIFQLLLRLKANTLWPAMHPGTRAFFKSADNQAMARRYQINIGSSHAEPMLRNNVDEWDHEKSGNFNYVSNTENVEHYWAERIEQVTDMPELSMFTLGMRGVHDSGMEGIDDDTEARAVLQRIIDRQREMLASIFNQPASSLKQVFTPYKEVLKLYKLGLSVPDDVTIVWPDDNYGYIRKLSSKQEQQRAGGAGVYYHLSYWGRPHDYLWLSSTHPALIKYEMQRAFANGARELWIANVGDIKPVEYNMEWFLHLGWAGPDSVSADVTDYLHYQFARDFSEAKAQELTSLLLDYYHLAFERRPEFMGWSQTEPTTTTQRIPWSDEKVINRLDEFDVLHNKAQRLTDSISERHVSAFFQLAVYPVQASAAMNRKWLYRELASRTENSGLQKKRLSEALRSHRAIQQLTREYNQMEGGKWAGMMDASPRRLPVFDAPELLLNAYIPESGKKQGDDPQSRLSVSGSTAPSGYVWRSVNELGYSRAAMSVFPLTNKVFDKQKPSLTFRINTESVDSAALSIATLPTHSNDYQHTLHVYIDDMSAGEIRLNTHGRSETWKQGVLANRIVNTIPLKGISAGDHTIRIEINQTGIVIDEVWLTQGK